MNTSWRGAIVGIALAMAGLANADAPLGVSGGDGFTTFRVWAPNATSVAVIGDFNNWKAVQGDHLVKDEATGVWSLTMKRSSPKGGYQFLINGSLARRDPYARAVTPDGRRSLFYDPDGFNWADDRAPGHALEDSVIYEMHIGAFYDVKPQDGAPATFADAVKKLDYLVQLGVTTLCVLPVHEFNGHHSWGYNPSDPFAVEQAYGGPDMLKAFVRACHARGLSVHLDIVHNHYGPQNLDLLQFDGPGNALNGGIYFYAGEGIGMTPWGPRLRYEDPMVRRYVRDNAMMWLEEYRVDGFRWDSTINIRAYNMGASEIPAGAQMLDEINREISALYPGRWSIAEDSLGIGTFHASWDYDFHHQVMPVLSAKTDEERDMRMIVNAIGRSGGMKRVVYVDNHDEAGKINGMQRIASDIDPANPGSDRARVWSGLGAVLTFTAPGIPLLFMGNEFQEHGTFHDDIPLDWGKASRHEGLLALHRDLISLRRNRGGVSGGLKGWDVKVTEVDHEQKTIVYWRSAAEAPDDVVVVAVNFASVPRDAVISFPSAGPWVMRLNTDSATYGGSARTEAAKPFTLSSVPAKARTTLAPASARIYSQVNRPASSVTESATTPAAPLDRPPFSMYAAMFLRSDANDWSKTAWPLTLVSDNTWEGRFKFEGAVNPAFALSANEDGVIYWGGRFSDSTLREGESVEVKRLGGNLAAPGTWNGTYRFRFNEETLTLEVTRVADTPEPIAEPDGGFRVWTDIRGKTVEARLLRMENQSVVLTRRDGQEITIPIDRLSESDQATCLGTEK